MHKEEKSVVKRKKRKTIYSSKSASEKSDDPPRKIGTRNSSSVTTRSLSEYMRKGNIREQGKKTLRNTLLLLSLSDGNAIEFLLITAQINTNFVNHPVPSTIEPSTSLVRVTTDACEFYLMLQRL
ncbi:uncharacterized protein TNCV_686741 [Trichonephila clavipes]|nr:uncharacterized protein TNCV_686741 [Trichonephila clavipes]